MYRQMPTEEILVEQQRMTQSVEPWLSKPSQQLLDDVSGFISFLSNKLTSSTALDLKQHKQVASKLKQLTDWRRTILSVASITSSTKENFLDRLPAQPKTDFQLLTTPQGTVFVLLQNRSNFDFEEREESKSEGGRNIATGFLLTKCLRKVRNNLESRDIFKAVKCDVDLNSRSIISQTQEEFVLKRVGKVQGREDLNNTLRREFQVQGLLSHLHHPNINCLAAYAEDEVSIFGISFSAGEVDMLDALLEKQVATDEASIAALFRGACEALLVAHNLGISHRDISLENLCLSLSETDQGMVKSLQVIDWGHAASTLGSELKYTGPLGKERYFAPELIETGRRVYNPFKCDVFAFGVCLFSALTGQMPFTKMSESDKRVKILKQGADVLLKRLKKDNLSESAISLLNGCLKFDPEERFDMKDVFCHEFFTNSES